MVILDEIIHLINHLQISINIYFGWSFNFQATTVHGNGTRLNNDIR